jgi:hypothetical protein
LHRSGILAEHLGHAVRTLTGRYQQYAVQPMVVTRLLRARDFLPDGYLHDLRVGDLQLAHCRLLV